jgi:Transposase DDE domain/Insertion element 4 transposase N-terminal
VGSHAVMPAARLPGGPGVLSWFVPPGLADEVAAQAAAERDAALAAAGEKVPRRRVRLLPPRVALYFTLALCLSARLPYREVMRSLAGPVPVPAATALTAARRRLGERALELLFWRVAGPLVTWREPWALACGLQLVAWDGTTLAAPASPGNAAAFGLPGTGTGGRGAAAGHFPRARVVALIACGTRALLGAAIGPLADGEQKLAGSLASCLQPGMLLLADRNFWSHALWRQCAATGADLLWRVKSSMLLPVARPLPDGSWLTTVNGTPQARRRAERNRHRRKRGGRQPQDTGPLPGDLTLRAIEFTVTVTTPGGTTRTRRYRAVTTLLDWRRHPAAALAAAYARRWEIETGYRDLKATLGDGRALRSRTPDLARQEIWAMLVACQAVRALACHAAATAGTSPARISFAAALRAARRHHGPAALAAASAEVAAQPLAQRPPRTCARAITARHSHFPLKRHAPQPLPQPVHYTTTITPPRTTTPHPRSQHEHPPSQPPAPP